MHASVPLTCISCLLSVNRTCTRFPACPVLPVPHPPPKVTNIHNGVQPMAFGSFISLFSYDASLTFTHTCFETKTKKPEV